MVNGRKTIGIKGGSPSRTTARSLRIAEQRKRNQARLKRSQKRIRAGTSNINEVFNPLV